jgi:dCMP deaminase
LLPFFFMNKRISWKEYALQIAMVAAKRSEDPYLKVGACVLRYDNSVAGVGYNGAPPKIEIDWSNRDERRKRVVHAEINALRYVRPNECYLLACTHIPCNECLRAIASYGIRDVVFRDFYANDNSSLEVCKDLGINIHHLII